MDLGISKNNKPNPRENANIFSVATLSFTLPTFFEGFRKDLEISDLYTTYSKHKSKTLGDKIEEMWEREANRASKSKTQPSLKRSIIKTFGLQYVVLGLLSILFESARIVQPLFLGQLMMYYVPHQNSITKSQAYGYAGGIIACSILVVILNSPYSLEMYHVGMKLRVACCSLIYRKALRLSSTALAGETTIGQMVNLLSNDVNRIETGVLFSHLLLIGPLHTILGTYFMYQEVGVSAVMGVGVLLLFIPLQIVLANKIAKHRSKAAHKTDERIRLMNEIIVGVQVIKMYTWEKPFAKLMSWARKSEIKYIQEALYFIGLIYSCYGFLNKTCLFVTILSYVLFDHQITAKKVFVVEALYKVIEQSMIFMFARCVTLMNEANVSVNRLSKFMLLDEKSPSTRTTITKTTQDTEKYGESSFIQQTSIYSISIENGLAKWNESSTAITTSNLNINIIRGSLVAIVGTVGSGKSSLLQVLLKELPLLQGNMEVHGRISYAAQEPWVFSGTIRQNITFNKPYNETTYTNVINTCALIKDLNTFADSDKTVVGERGVTLSGGQRARISLARAVYQDADIYLLDDPLSAVDADVGKILFNNCIKGYLNGKTVILVTHQLHCLKNVDYIITLEDGAVKAQGTFEELLNYGLDFTKLLKNELKDEKVVQPIKHSESSSLTVEPFFDYNNVGVKSQNKEQHAKGAISKATYVSYFTAATNSGFVVVVLLLFVFAEAASSLGNIFLTRWVNMEEAKFLNNSGNDAENNWNDTSNTNIYTYTGIIISCIIFSLSRSFFFFSVCMKSSVKLHDNMFNGVVNATMRFFNENSSGRILNRFSKDLGGIDEVLPMVAIDTVQIFLLCFFNIVVIATVNPLLLIPAILLMIILFLLRIVYLRTSRCVKRLEGVTRSPVFNHLNASLHGLTTIRALGADSNLIDEFDTLQDLHSATWFLFISTARAFGYWLDLLCLIFVATVTLSFLLYGDTNLGGNVGLAISQSFGLIGLLQWGVHQSAEMENQMTSVERVLQYTNIERERLGSPPNAKLSPSWPQFGKIQFANVNLRYFAEDPPILKNLSFTIKSMEKIGVAGRTGAGKSSLISALFQLTDIDGSILIDDVNIKDLGLHDLRSKMSVIPQEPVLFAGTLRKNLDPFDEHSDEDLWKSLDAVELKNAIAEMNLGLCCTVLERGGNFSVGQRQLICLARAILRNNKILILDEATASVDLQTDSLIQATIRKEFASCTVLTIAHRLNTIMDSDKVLLIDSGEIAEFSHPYLLLQNQNGAFYKMVAETGTGEKLKIVARRNYEKNKMLAKID